MSNLELILNVKQHWAQNFLNTFSIFDCKYIFKNTENIFLYSKEDSTNLASKIIYNMTIYILYRLF